jgi:hypothetical protein
MSISMQNLLMTSDIFVAAVGAGYAGVYGMSPGMVAVKASLISSVARMVSESKMMPATALTADAKNQIVVAVLHALDAYRVKGSVLKGAVNGVSIDLIAQEVMKLLNFTDQSLLGGGGATA